MRYRNLRTVCCSKGLMVLGFLGLTVTMSVTAASRDPLKVDLPLPQVPNGAQAQWIAEKMAMNGLAMSIRSFTYQGELQPIREFYAEDWSKLGCPAIAEIKQVPGYLLSCQIGKHYFSVQLQDFGNSVRGVATVSELPSATVLDTKTRFPILRSTRVVQKIEANDAGSRSETLILKSNESLEMNRQYIDNQLTSDGWLLETLAQNDRPLTPRQTNIYKKKSQLVQITYVPSDPNSAGGTDMFVNWIK